MELADAKKVFLGLNDIWEIEYKDSIDNSDSERKGGEKR